MKSKLEIQNNKNVKIIVLVSIVETRIHKTTPQETETLNFWENNE